MFRLSRRCCWSAIAIATVLIAWPIAFGDNTSDPRSESPFLGIWSTHYQQTFITVIINPDGTAQFLLIDQGHSIGTVTWKPAANGIIVEGLPRLRFWSSPNINRARVMMEALPPEMTNDTMQRFPLSFYMNRGGGGEDFAERWSKRPLPAAWMTDEPPAGFDNVAGQPRKYPR